MTKLLIALIQAILEGSTLRDKLIEYANLPEFYNESRLDDVLDDFVVPGLTAQPLLIPFWFLTHFKGEMPATLREVIHLHPNHSRQNEFLGIYDDIVERTSLDYLVDVRESVLADLNKDKDPDDDWTSWADMFDLLRSDFDGFYDIAYRAVLPLKERHHINEGKLREAAGLPKDL